MSGLPVDKYIFTYVKFFRILLTKNTKNRINGYILARVIIQNVMCSIEK